LTSSDLLRCPDCRSTLAPAEETSRLRCTSCSATYPEVDGIFDLVGSKSQLNASEVETQDRVSDEYENVRYRHAYSRRYHESTLDKLTTMVTPHGVVLDNGCGNGLFLEHLAGQGLPISRYVGIDVSMGMLRHARARLDELDSVAGVPTELVRADACRLPFADDTFDVIFARSLLHHLPDPAAGAAEMARTLKPGGSVVVLDPNRTFVSDLPRRLARMGEHFDDDHKNFRLSELESILSANLDIEKVEFVGYLAYPLLGFPDLIDFGKVLPLDRLAPLVIRVDDGISRLPLLKRLGWGVMFRAGKR
jgi:SAM-dependent methyltransferase/uncharacterized protein YbaR (Trm112 family)